MFVIIEQHDFRTQLTVIDKHTFINIHLWAFLVCLVNKEEVTLTCDHLDFQSPLKSSNSFGIIAIQLINERLFYSPSNVEVVWVRLKELVLPTSVKQRWSGIRKQVFQFTMPLSGNLAKQLILLTS
jgi:hypothetical protein